MMISALLYAFQLPNLSSDSNPLRDLITLYVMMRLQLFNTRNKSVICMYGTRIKFVTVKIK